MWTVTIRDTGVKDEAITLQVEFTKGDESIVRNFAGNTKAEIDRRIKQQLDALKARDENIALVQTGEWKEPVEEPTPEPTAEEQAQAAWLEQWNRYKGALAGMKALAEAGVEPTAEEKGDFEALKRWVADNRKKEYTHLIGNDI